MSDVALFAGDRYFRSQFNTGQASYTVFQKDGVTYADPGYPGGISYSGTDAATVIQNALNALPAGRVSKARVVLKGEFTIHLQTIGGLQIGLLLPSYVVLDIRGKLSVDPAQSLIAASQNFMVRAQTQTDIDIIGGEINGNGLGNGTDNRLYGIELADCTRVLVENVYVHDTSETGIAFEGTTSFARAINCITKLTGQSLTVQDGIGNQSTCTDINYIGNICQSAGRNCLTIEGGSRITAIGNICRDSGQNGISIQSGAGGMIIANNQCFNNAVEGIIIAPSASHITVVGNVVYQNTGDGIAVEGPNNAISGNIVYNNDFLQTGHSGILVTSGANENSITSNVCFDNQTPKKQDYGIAFLTGADLNVCNGNDVSGNQSGGILIQAATSSNKCFDNRGFNPQGILAITVTASPFTYTNNDGVPEAVYIDAGTVSIIAKNAITVFTSTGKMVWLEPGEALTVTYSVLPTMNRDRK